MRTILAALVLAAVPVSVLAETRLYECTMANLTPALGWITETYVILYDEAGGTAKVEDAITQTYVGKPVDAKVTGKTEKKVAFVWSVKTTDSEGQHTSMQYRAAVYADGKITVTAKPGSYRNMFEARGTCSAKKAKG